MYVGILALTSNVNGEMPMQLEILHYFEESSLDKSAILAPLRQLQKQPGILQVDLLSMVGEPPYEVYVYYGCR